MLEKVIEALGDNKEALDQVNEFTEKFGALSNEVSKWESTANEAIAKRDKQGSFIKELKSKLNIEDNVELTGDLIDSKIKNIKAPEPSEREMSLQKEIESIANELNSKNSEIENIHKEYKQKEIQNQINGIVTEAVEKVKVAPGNAIKELKNLVSQGAIIEDGKLTFKNEDGTTLRKNGSPFTVEDKIESLKSSEDFAYLFASEAKTGSGLQTKSVETGKVNLSKAAQMVYDNLNRK